MPTYLSPGVFVEEVPAGVVALEGVGTSTGAFVGLAEKGELNTPVLVTNFTQFTEEFGNFIPNSQLAYAVLNFFAEGGTRCYVVRVNGTGEATGSVDLTAFTLNAISAGAWSDDIDYTIEDPSTQDPVTHFKLTVTYNAPAGQYIDAAPVVEVYDDVALADIESLVNGVSSFVTISGITTGRPANVAATALSGGVDGTVDYIGTSSSREGIHAFDPIDDVNIVAIPDIAGQRTEISAAIAYCENRGDAFFIADPPAGETVTGIVNFRQGTAPYTGGAFNSAYSALYYPRVYMRDPATGRTRLVPPSGSVAGIYASTDETRGVHKAPAGTNDGAMSSVVGVEAQITKGEQDVLNPLGINAIRSFPQSGIVLWGSRTLSSDPEWRYLNVRRLMLFIKESLDEGTQFVVFEPNDPALWGRVRRILTAFLTRVWRDGALFGNTAEEAFFVKVDEENNPAAVRDAGQLIIDVGVAPVKPAEFVVIRIQQTSQAGS